MKINDHIAFGWLQPLFNFRAEAVYVVHTHLHVWTSRHALCVVVCVDRQKCGAALHPCLEWGSEAAQIWTFVESFQMVRGGFNFNFVLLRQISNMAGPLYSLCTYTHTLTTLSSLYFSLHSYHFSCIQHQFVITSVDDITHVLWFPPDGQKVMSTLYL